jgi:hypothetical chaperone protein
MAHCGIDFGTSNTTMTVMVDGIPTLLPLEGDALTLPTAIFFPQDHAQAILFGRAAQAAYLSGVEGRLLRSLKRVLGTSLMQQGTFVRSKRWQFTDIIGLFLSHIKTKAEQQLQHELKAVTIGRPVHFQDGDPDADNQAQQQLYDIAQKCGFETIYFQFEPVAAALSHEMCLHGEELAIVIDIGGGTSDFSIIRLNPRRSKKSDRSQDILAHSGLRVGGNDCDKALNLEIFMPHCGLNSTYGDKNLAMPVWLYHDLSEWSKINTCYIPQNINMVEEIKKETHALEQIAVLQRLLHDQEGHRLLDQAEQLKINLATHDKAQANLGFLRSDWVVSYTQKKMNKSLEKIMAPIEKMLFETINQANIDIKDITTVILTGGTTALPFFQNWLMTHFAHATIRQDNRLGSVGLGLVL